MSVNVRAIVMWTLKKTDELKHTSCKLLTTIVWTEMRPNHIGYSHNNNTAFG